MNTKLSLVTLGLRVLLIAGSLSCGTSHAQGWPARPVRIVVATAPGGTADTLGRLIAQKLTEDFKQNFVVENRTGAGGVIACELVTKAAPDGYTLLVVGGTTHTILPTLTKNLPYDSVRDFTHIALLGGPPSVLVVHPGLPARDLKEFIALARAQPGKLTYGSPGNGTTGHLTAEHFKQLSGIDMTHVPYKGASPAVADLMAGHLPVASTTLATAATQIRAGKVKALALSSATRVPDFPNVPTFAELGYPELTALAWFALSGPAGMPQEIVQRLNAEVRRILQLADVRERLRPEGFEPGNLDSQAFTAFVAAELKRWAPVARASGMRVD